VAVRELKQVGQTGQFVGYIEVGFGVGVSVEVILEVGFGVGVLLHVDGGRIGGEVDQHGTGLLSSVLLI
jgi:hypothetical protein